MKESENSKMIRKVIETELKRMFSPTINNETKTSSNQTDEEMIRDEVRKELKKMLFSRIGDELNAATSEDSLIGIEIDETPEVKTIINKIQSHINAHEPNNNLWCVGTSSNSRTSRDRKEHHEKQKEDPDSKRTAFKNWMEPIYHDNSHVIESAELYFVENEDERKKTEGGAPPKFAPAQHYIYAYQCFESESDL